jgi:hypothetical protein
VAYSMCEGRELEIPSHLGTTEHGKQGPIYERLRLLKEVLNRIEYKSAAGPRRMSLPRL